MKKKVILLPLIMMALASCGGNSASNSVQQPSTSGSTSQKPSTSTGDTSVTPVGTTNIADVVKAGFDGTAGTTEYTFEGTVVGLIGDNSYYLQQGDAGIYVYKTAATGNAIGKKVKVVSKITNYNGLIETDYATSATVTGDGEAITAVTYTTKTFKKENQCTLANIKGLKYESGSISLGSSAMLTFKEGTENVLVRVDKNLDDSIETAIKEKLESLGGNDTVDFVNTILYMNSKDGVNTVTVGLTSVEQMVINRGEKVSVTGVTADESIEVTVGKTTKITASVVPANASEKGLTFKSNDETKATVDAQGVVTGVAEGNTTITVASKDDATKVATVNVTVKAKGETPVAGKLELTKDSLFPGLSGTSYATYNGDHTVGDYTVTTSDVLGNTNNTYDVLQFKKLSGFLTVEGTFKKVTIEIESTLDYSDDNAFSVYVGANLQTIDSAAINAARVDSGKTSGKYKVYLYTIVMELETAQTDTFKIAKESTGAGYALKITLE